MQGRRELSRAGTALAERPNNLELIAPKYPDLLMSAVGNVQELLIGREIEVPHRRVDRGLPGDEDLLLKHAILAEDLEPAVAPIADIDEAVAIDTEAMYGVAELSGRRSRGVDGRLRGRIIRLLAVCAPMTLVSTGLRVEHNHPVVLVLLAVRYVDLVSLEIDAHLRRAARRSP